MLICGAVTNPFEHMFFTHHVGYVYLASGLAFRRTLRILSLAFGRDSRRENPLMFF